MTRQRGGTRGRRPGPATAQTGEKLPETIGRWRRGALLARAPGALLYAADNDERSALLQLIPLRPVTPGGERKELGAVIARLDSATQRLLEKDPDLDVLEHGVHDSGDGAYCLYWVLPATPAVDRLGPEGAHLGSPDELAILTHALLERLESRHSRGLFDPLLCGALVACDPTQGPTVLGVPVAVEDRWLAPQVPPLRLEELEVSTPNPVPSAQGDLARLRSALSEVAAPLGPLPGPLVKFLERLGASPDGFSSAREALQMLERLDEEGRLGIRPKTLSTPRIASAQTVVVPQPAIPQAQDTIATVPPPMEGAGEVAGHDDGTVAASPRSREQMPTIRSMQSRRATEDRLPVQQIDVEASEETHDGPFASEPTAPVRSVTPRSITPSDGTVVGVRLPGPEYLARRTPVGQPAPAPGYGRIVPGPTVPGASVPPVSLPPGASVPPGAPLPVAPAALPPASGPYAALPPSPPATDDVPVEISGRTKLMMALGILVAGAIALVGVELLAPVTPSKLETSMVRTVDRLEARDDVLLTVQPDSATILSERDGQILGRGRIRVLVGREPPAILAAAPGHVPVRLPLPHRGEVSIRLAPIDPDQEACEAELEYPRKLELQDLDGVAFPSGPVSVSGAQIVRDRSGQGAWLIRCPSRGETTEITLESRPPPRRIELTILEPEGARIIIDGEPQGRAPLARTVQSGFVKVEADALEWTVQRWVPAYNDTEIRMRIPSPRPDESAVKEEDL